MKLKDQVCSLDLAKALKELGVEQDGYFLWVRRRGGWLVWDWDQTMRSDYETGREEEFISAFTTSELIELFVDDCVVMLEQFTPASGATVRKYGAYNDIGLRATGTKVADVLAELLRKTLTER